MDARDKKDFAIAWAGAWEMCGQTPTDRAVMFAFECLLRYDIADIKKALIMHANNPDGGQFAPKPADIARQIDGTGDERSLAAWTRVEEAISSFGSWTPLVFDDAKIHACIGEMGGWERFVGMTYDELPFVRNEFCKRYRAYMHTAPTVYPAKLVADGNGDPVFIGNRDEAKMVMIGGGKARTTDIQGLLNEASQKFLEN